jgi:succinate-semialdehyde dehydrogenase/glutarate-semialdehyde dehydrogenase
MIVEESVHDDFMARFLAGIAAQVVGDPHAPETTIGPMARRDLREQLAAQVDATLSAGARLVYRGTCPDGPGWYYPPTVLTDIPRDAPAYHEELFGPVACVYRVPDLAAAVDLANDSPFGLGASLWTRDPVAIDYAVCRLKAGSVFVNGMVKSDPRLPFGGIKQSGFGRELGLPGLLAFTNMKTVWIA